jgi:hypothetical protein
MAIRILNLAAKGARPGPSVQSSARVRPGADVAFTGRSSFGSMHPTLMMKFLLSFYDIICLALRS